MKSTDIEDRNLELLDEILEKIKEIVATHGEHYDDMDRADISKLQNNIEGRKKRIKLFGPRKR